MPDREKVIEGLEKVWDAFNHIEHELYADYVFDALELLKEQSDCENCAMAIEDRQIVRCKDCKYWDQLMEHRGLCHELTNTHSEAFVTSSDWFCAYGERKSE